MSIKNALEKYFKDLLEGYSETADGFPIIPKRKDVDPMIYVGEPDEEGWCRWKPIIKDKMHDLKEIEEENKLELHLSIREYLNSFWFLKIKAKFKNYKISMHSVEPNRELNPFKELLKGYKLEHNNELKHIPLGSEMKIGYLIVVDNETGEVKFEDYDKSTFKTIAGSLEEFILSLEPIII